MPKLHFPVTKANAKKRGLQYSSDANKKALFPTRLRELRREKGVSQEVLAKKLEISKSTLGLYETGDTLPDVETAVKMATIFGVSANYLLCMTDYKTIEREGKLAKDLGLSEIAVDTLTFYHERREFLYPSLIGVINLLIEQEEPSPAEAKMVHEYVYYDEAEFFEEQFGTSINDVSEDDLTEFRDAKEYYSKLEEKLESVKRETVLTKIRNFIAIDCPESKCRITDSGDLIVEEKVDLSEEYYTINRIPTRKLVERVLLDDISSAISNLKHIATLSDPTALQKIVIEAKNGIFPEEGIYPMDRIEFNE